MESQNKFRFSIDRGGTFTDVYAECPGGRVRVMKLLSEDPLNYPDAPRRPSEEFWKRYDFDHLIKLCLYLAIRVEKFYVPTCNWFLAQSWLLLG